jgi:hypothetical protein
VVALARAPALSSRKPFVVVVYRWSFICLRKRLA